MDNAIGFGAACVILAGTAAQIHLGYIAGALGVLALCALAYIIFHTKVEL